MLKKTTVTKQKNRTIARSSDAGQFVTRKDMEQHVDKMIRRYKAVFKSLANK